MVGGIGEDLDQADHADHMNNVGDLGRMSFNPEEEVEYMGGKDSLHLSDNIDYEEANPTEPYLNALRSSLYESDGVMNLPQLA